MRFVVKAARVAYNMSVIIAGGCIYKVVTTDNAKDVP